MKVEELKKILENKIANLELNKISALNNGQLEHALLLEQEILDTKEILSKLE